ncbi:MAG TPA: hypothetical protein VK590_08835 [Saprospiraceae bacterium]|nr:hypothetical protein [Saprospiraceae bacterium]
MYQFILILISYLFLPVLVAQNGESIIAILKSINLEINNDNCNSKNAAAISNRALNVFLADKTGYLSEYGDLSFYTNYLTLNTLEGKLTINHNFKKASGKDDPIRKLFSVGVNMNIANGFSRSFSDNKIENELGITLNYKWIGKVRTRFSNCDQKLIMDALRSGIVHALEIEIKARELDFKKGTEKIDTIEIPGQKLNSAKEIIIKDFYKNLEEEFAEKYAKLQAEKLTDTRNFKLITSNWTSFNIYIPMAFPKYNTAESLSSTISIKHPYPMNVSLNHTRYWECNTIGRLFFTLGANAYFNNSKLSYQLNKLTPNDYLNQGGSDTLHLASFKNDYLYLGDYNTFITTSIKARLFYFPPDSHVGISLTLEKYFGKYIPLIGKLGIPIVLINSKKLPAANFEIDVQFFDMTNKIDPSNKSGNKVFVGLEVGVPFSRLMY